MDKETSDTVQQGFALDQIGVGLALCAAALIGYGYAAGQAPAALAGASLLVGGIVLTFRSRRGKASLR